MTITHPEKVLFPDDGITKGELAAYYDAVAPVMLPHLRAPPDHDGALPVRHRRRRASCRRTSSRAFPAWLQRVEAPKKGGTVHYPLADDARSLQWIANQNTITLHVWTSRAPRLERPDLCVFDLDPSHDEPSALRDGRARGARRCSTSSGMPSWVKTSGSKGFHIVVPLEARPRRSTTSRASPTTSARSWSRAIPSG